MVFSPSTPFVSVAGNTYYVAAAGYSSSTTTGLITVAVTCLPISGCTDSLATNYDSTATVDDGSCVYPCLDN